MGVLIRYMSDVIKLLSDSIANQIAAGEVVQRPASVIKELVENSIDAGATSVQVIVELAGKQLVQIVDNGRGMTETDARLSFERHATSKIKEASDLGQILSFGFRGEALASIAAIAQVEMRTRHEDRELGTRILIEGTQILLQEPCNTTIGTNLAVRNLFFNTPARKNFLKSDPVEMKHIVEEFHRIALAHPEIAFTLHHNEKELYRLPMSNLRQRLVALFGKKSNESWVPLSESTEVVDINGFISKPEFAKKKRGEQYFFVNRRFIKSPYLHHAIQRAYQDIVPQGMYPAYVIFLDINPALIDVNVHPTKHEIKFQDEKLIYKYLHVCSRHALGKFNISPSLEFNDRIDLSDQSRQNTQFAGSGGGNQKREFDNLNQWRRAFEGMDQFSIPSVEQDKTTTLFETTEDQTLTSLNIEDTDKALAAFQIHNKYIVTQIKSGMIIIDQKAAHERIVYEDLHSKFANAHIPRQQLIFPISLKYNIKDTHILLDHLEQINTLGIEMEHFGGESFIVRGLPSGMEESSVEGVIEGLLEGMTQGVIWNDTHTDTLIQKMAMQMSMNRAKHLTESEISELISSLFGCEMPYKSPRGHFTLITLELDELEKRFKS